MYKVLLVDDEILVRDAIRENLDWNSLGFELAGDCENGKEAIEFVKQQEVDVVITDICMPYVDGMQLSEFLFNNYPEVAIIIFSGFGEFEYAKKAIQYKVSEYILKPVTAMELSEILVRLKDKLDHQVFEDKKIEKLQKAYKNYRKNESLIASRSLCNLVMGSQDVETVTRELGEMNFHFTGTDYRVGVVDIDLYSDLYEVDEETKKESALMTFVVENISNEILERRGAGVAFRDTGNRVFLMLWTTKPKEFLKQTMALCKEIQDNIFEAMKLSVSITLGSYVQKLDELYLSYEESKNALSYRYTKGDGMIIDCEEQAGNFDGEIFVTEYIEALKEAIKGNETEEIERIFGDLKQIHTYRYIKRDKIIMCLQQISREVAELSLQLKGEERTGKEREELLGNVIKCRNAQLASDEVKSYALMIAEDLSDYVSSSTGRQAMLAMGYIKDNYANQELGLNHICKYLNISTSYFSSLFKDATGETFMEVLIRIRMDKAKELLEETTLRIYEIAERVGFSDPHYFSISFKKMTGMLPTEYAKEKRKK